MSFWDLWYSSFQCVFPSSTSLFSFHGLLCVVNSSNFPYPRFRVDFSDRKFFSSLRWVKLVSPPLSLSLPTSFVYVNYYPSDSTQYIPVNKEILLRFNNRLSLPGLNQNSFSLLYFIDKTGHSFTRQVFIYVYLGTRKVEGTKRTETILQKGEGKVDLLEG